MWFIALLAATVLALVSPAADAASDRRADRRAAEKNAGETHYQMQLLQGEVMALRGQVEELTHQVEQLKANQNERYLELDGRLQQFMKQLNAAQGAQGSSLARVSRLPDSRAGAASGLTEKDIYDTAQQLIRNRQYEVAITQLDTLISRYPDGDYIGNAYFWLGEVYAAMLEYDKARAALTQVISYFPDHRKVPDAEFKLGKVYHLQGDCDRAEEILKQVVEKHRGKSVARLAENYLQESVACGS